MTSIDGRLDPRGPFLDSTLMASPQHVARLRAAGKLPPGARTVRTLIDTGAAGCVLDFAIIRDLGLIQTGKTLIHTPTTGSNYLECDLYDACFFLGAQPGSVAFYVVSVVGSDLASEGFLAIIGWPILIRCVLTCDGPAGTFRLDYRPSGS